MNVLTVIFCASAILDCKFRATVQTAETHCAFILRPYRPLVLHFNCVNGAFSCAQSAADAAFLNSKIICFAGFAVIDCLASFAYKIRQGGVQMSAPCLAFNHIFDQIQLTVRLFIYAFDKLLVG